MVQLLDQFRLFPSVHSQRFSNAKNYDGISQREKGEYFLWLEALINEILIYDSLRGEGSTIK